MRLTDEAATHAGCTDLCGAHNASLACLESQEDYDLAVLVSPKDRLAFVWLGEYQWPVEPLGFGKFRFIDFTQPYFGQSGWGMCTNGRKIDQSSE